MTLSAMPAPVASPMHDADLGFQLLPPANQPEGADTGLVKHQLAPRPLEAAIESEHIGAVAGNLVRRAVQQNDDVLGHGAALHRERIRETAEFSNQRGWSDTGSSTPSMAQRCSRSVSVALFEKPFQPIEVLLVGCVQELFKLLVLFGAIKQHAPGQARAMILVGKTHLKREDVDRFVMRHPTILPSTTSSNVQRL
jgi:hypothetical protein